MKYGALNIPIPEDFQEDKASLVELLDAGEITQQEYQEKLRKLNYNYLMFIANTNNTSLYTSKKLARKKTLSALRDDFVKKKTQEIAKQVTEAIQETDKVDESSEQEVIT